MKLLRDKDIQIPFWVLEQPDKEAQKDIQKYGVDPRECFSLDYAFIVWIYQRLIIYKRDAEKMVDLEYNKIKVKDSEISLLEAVEKMIMLLEEYLKDDVNNLETEESLLDEFMDIFSVSWRYLWW